jgi:Fe-S oxidoreductase
MNGNRKIAYFSGCTANYRFPEVPKAVVEIFQKMDSRSTIRIRSAVVCLAFWRAIGK